MRKEASTSIKYRKDNHVFLSLWAGQTQWWEMG